MHAILKPVQLQRDAFNWMHRISELSCERGSRGWVRQTGDSQESLLMVNPVYINIYFYYMFLKDKGIRAK